jgi:TP901 family phage tail tape measure protein
MPVDAGTIYSEVRIALDKLKGDISKMEAAFDKFGKTNDTQSQKVKKNWKDRFKEINLAGVAAFAAIGLAVKQAIGIFAKFEQAMANVRSVTDATAEDFNELNEAALEAGETTRFTATQAAEALYFLASAGFDAAESIAALDGVMKLAGATGSDLAFTASTVAATISQFSLEAEDATRVANVFSAAISNSQATMAKLQTALKQVGPISGALNISLEETTASLEALFNAGFAGEQAGTALRNILLDLSNSTGPVVQRLKQLGIAFEDINPEKVGLTNAIETLAESGIDLGEVFGKRVAAQMLVLAKTGGDALRELEAEITNTNSAAEMYATQNDTLAGSIDFLKSAVESASIKLVAELAPALRGIIDFLTMVVNGFNQLPGPVKTGIAIFAAGIPIVTGLTFAFTSLAAVLGTIAAPVTIIVGSIAALTGVMVGIAEATKDYNARFLIAAEKTEDQRIQVEDLLKRYNELKTSTDKTAESQSEMLNVIDQLNTLVPDLTLEFDEFNNIIGINAEKVIEFSKELIGVQIENLEAQKRLREEDLKNQQEVIDFNEEWLQGLIAQGEAEEDLIELSKLLNDSKQQYVSISQNIIELDNEIGTLRRQLDREAYEAEQERLAALEAEEAARKLLAEEQAKLARERALEQEALEKELAKIREDYRVSNLTDEENEIEKLDAMWEDYRRAGVGSEEEYQEQLEEIKEKYRKKEEDAESDKINALAELQKQYTDQLEKIGKTQLELIEIERRQAKESIEATEATVEQKEEAIKAVNEYYDTLRDNTANEEFIQNMESIASVTLSTFKGLMGSISQLYKAMTNERLADLDDRMERELEAAGLLEETEIERLQAELDAAIAAGDTETAEQARQDIERLKIEQKYEQQRAQIKYEGERKIWAVTLTTAIADGAAAIISGFATKPFIPVGIIAGALATGLVAAQLAVVAKNKPQPPSFARGGIVIPSGSEGREVTVADDGAELLLSEGSQGEAFLNQFAQRISDQIQGSQGGNINIQLYVDGKKLAESNANYFNNGIVRLKV